MLTKRTSRRKTMNPIPPSWLAKAWIYRSFGRHTTKRARLAKRTFLSLSLSFSFSFSFSFTSLVFVFIDSLIHTFQKGSHMFRSPLILNTLGKHLSAVSQAVCWNKDIFDRQPLGAIAMAAAAVCSLTSRCSMTSKNCLILCFPGPSCVYLVAIWRDQQRKTTKRQNEEQCIWQCTWAH